MHGAFAHMPSETQGAFSSHDVVMIRLIMSGRKDYCSHDIGIMWSMQLTRWYHSPTDDVRRHGAFAHMTSKAHGARGSHGVIII